jgi:hypothetical protein
VTRDEYLHLLAPVQVRNVIYTGAIWGGVQIRDVAMAEIADIAASSLDNYQGLYSDLVDAELASMVTNDWENR